MASGTLHFAIEPDFISCGISLVKKCLDILFAMLQFKLPDKARILIIKPSALGDICHALPVLSFLRSKYPTAHLAWLVNNSLAPLLSGHALLDELILFDRAALGKGLIHGFMAWNGLTNRLRRTKWDLVLDLQGLARSGLMAFLARSQRRWGLADAREGSRLAYSRQIRIPNLETHAVIRYWQAARFLGGNLDPIIPQLILPPIETDKANTMMSMQPRPWLVAAPGARWITKRWPPTSFAKVIDRALNSFGGTAWIVGARDESMLGASLRSSMSNQAIDLTGSTSLLEMAAVLGQADMVLANDSGPLHVAVALGRQVVCPFLCTRPRLTGPFGQTRHVVWAKSPCRGSLVRICPTKMECMNDLEWSQIYAVVESILSQARENEWGTKG